MLPQILALGIELITSLSNGIASASPELIPAIAIVVEELVTMLTSGDTLDLILETALTLVLALGQGLSDSTPTLVSAVTNIVEGINKFATNPENLALIVATAIELIIALAGGIISAIPELIKSVEIVILDIIANFKDADWPGMGKNIVDGLKKGIESAWSNLKKWFGNLFGDLSDIAKKILGIASPSKVFQELGKFTAEGFGVGFGDQFVRVKNNMESLMTFDTISATTPIMYPVDGSGAITGATAGVTVIQNIYSQSQTAADLMMEAQYEQELAMLTQVP
jgi:hypothetical protein